MGHVCFFKTGFKTQHDELELHICIKGCVKKRQGLTSNTFPLSFSSYAYNHDGQMIANLQPWLDFYTQNIKTITKWLNSLNCSHTPWTTSTNIYWVCSETGSCAISWKHFSNFSKLAFCIVLLLVVVINVQLKICLQTITLLKHIFKARTIW